MDALTREPGTYFEDFNGERRVMTIKNVSYSGWKIVGISYVDELVTNKSTLTGLLFLFPFWHRV